jgi:hypothetical protein
MALSLTIYGERSNKTLSLYFIERRGKSLEYKGGGGVQLSEERKRMEGNLKGLSHEMDFKNFDQNLKNLA